MRHNLFQKCRANMDLFQLQMLISEGLTRKAKHFGVPVEQFDLSSKFFIAPPWILLIIL